MRGLSEAEALESLNTVLKELAFERGFNVGLVLGLIVGIIGTSIVFAIAIRWAMMYIAVSKEKRGG